jgi:hypothetical protein
MAAWGEGANRSLAPLPGYNLFQQNNCPQFSCLTRGVQFTGRSPVLLKRGDPLTTKIGYVPSVSRFRRRPAKKSDAQIIGTLL